MLLYVFEMLLAEDLVMIEMDKMEMNIHLMMMTVMMEGLMVVVQVASRGSALRLLPLVLSTTSTPWTTP
jgi:hypothetical protein